MELNIYKVILGIYILHLFVVRAGWIEPDDSQPSFSSTVTDGTIFEISWTSIDSTTYNTTLSTLWVTTYDYDLVAFQQLLGENVDTGNNGTFDWNISIPLDILSQAAKYVLRFKDFNSDYDSSTVSYSSPGFLVINGAAGSSFSSSSSSSSSPSSSSTTGSTPTTTTANMTATPVASTTGSTNNSTAPTATHSAESGGGSSSWGWQIAVICLGFVGFLLIMTWLFGVCRRERKKEDPVIESPTYQDAPKKQPAAYTGDLVEMGEREPMELEAIDAEHKKPVELAG